MKKIILIPLIIIFIFKISLSKTIRLGLTNPTPLNLERILYLVDNSIIELDSLQIIGIYHKDQDDLIKLTNQYIRETRVDNVSIITIQNHISPDSLFMKNQCTSEFQKLFLITDGFIFFGGEDIPPSLYGEKTKLTTNLIPNERNWELSFLFHLTGRNVNNRIIPFLEQKPDYLILGICLGMQEMNVAGGGTLYQDIPIQIYKKKTFESVLELNIEKQHKNYRNKIDNWSEDRTAMQLHHIKIVKNSNLDYHNIRKYPLVASVHHQAVKKLGKNYKVAAFSLDKKIVEAIKNIKYRNVYGIQFHPERSEIYQKKIFIDSGNNPVSFNENDILFHKLFWKDFSNRLSDSATK